MPSRRWGLIATSVCTLGWLTGCASAQPANDDRGADCGVAVSARACDRVLRYAHEQVNESVARPASNVGTWPDAVTVVSVRWQAGIERLSNVGPACSSGRLVIVDVIGVFAVAVAPAGLPRGRPTPDYTVDDLVITADAASGRPCLLTVRTREHGPDHAPSGAVIVFER